MAIPMYIVAIASALLLFSLSSQISQVPLNVLVIIGDGQELLGYDDIEAQIGDVHILCAAIGVSILLFSISMVNWISEDCIFARKSTTSHFFPHGICIISIFLRRNLLCAVKIDFKLRTNLEAYAGSDVVESG